MQEVTDSKTVETTRTVSLRRNYARYLELAIDVASFTSIVSLAFAVWAVLSTPTRIQMIAPDTLLVQGVEFRFLVVSLFLANLSGAYQVLKRLRLWKLRA